MSDSRITTILDGLLVDEPKTDSERITALSVAISLAADQLEGWIAWKCPRKHRGEHDAFVAKLRAVREHATKEAR